MTVLGKISQRPCVTKRELIEKWSGTAGAITARIHRAIKQHTLIQLKKGLYIQTESYFKEPDKVQLTEYLASQICSPSYMSLEYVLKMHGILPHQKGKNPITSVTTKSTRSFTNPLGEFSYQSLSSSWYEHCANIGIGKMEYEGHVYYKATKARALFDYLYLHHGLNRRNQKQLKNQIINGLNIEWGNFSDADLEEFDQCVWRSNSKKMVDVLAIIRDHLEQRKPNSWLKDVLGIE